MLLFSFLEITSINVDEFSPSWRGIMLAVLLFIIIILIPLGLLASFWRHLFGIYS